MVRNQDAPTANMPSSTRSSRQTISMTWGWPPCEFQKTIFRTPARQALLATLEPDAGQHVVWHAQRAGKGEVLVGFADRQGRQDQRRQIVRHQGDGTLDDAGIDGRVDPHRKMRAVLLDGTDRAGPRRCGPCRARRSPRVDRSHHQRDEGWIMWSPGFDRTQLRSSDADAVKPRVLHFTEGRRHLSSLLLDALFGPIPRS